MTKLDFRISSGLKNIIGKELITDDFIAIFELVKNSYDANAKKVQIIFENVKPQNKDKGSKIFIIDDGDGMSLNDLQNKWLFIAHSEKKDPNDIEKNDNDFRDKIQKKRIKAGAKGIGRFSCDRLGAELNLFTKKGHEKIIHKLYTNWKKFEADTTKEFQTVKVDYDYLENLNEEDALPIQNFEKGTILEIYNLNSAWDSEKILKLKRYLQRLINPIEENEFCEFEIILQAKEFLIDDEKAKKKDKKFEIINGPVQNIVFENLGIKTTQINCTIDANGEKIFTELIDKGDFIFSLEEKNDFKLLKNIKIKLFYLNKSAKQSFSMLMGIDAIRYGSIFVYKNQFRIHPYGDEDNDWLELEKRKTQGYKRNLATREVLGRVEINGNQTGFTEASSRDSGFYKSESFDQLKKFLMDKALKRLQKFVVEGIYWDSENKPITKEEITYNSLKIANEFFGKIKDPEKKVIFNDKILELIERKQIDTLPEVIKNIENVKKIAQTPEQEIYIDNQIKAVKSVTKTLQKGLEYKIQEVTSLKDDVKKTEEQNLFLKSIAGQEKTEIVSLQHQIGLSTSNIENHLIFIKERILKGKEVSNDDLLNKIDKILLEIKKITTVVKFVTKATFDLKREEVELNLPLFIKQYIEEVYIENEALLITKKVKIYVKNADNFSAKCLFKPLEFAIIIDNLISNSIKAGSNEISISIKKEDPNGILLIIDDDGKGIKEEDIKDIFNFGFTRTGGSGIGLYHVKEIVERLNGTVSLIPKKSKGATFEIKINQLKVSN